MFCQRSIWRRKKSHLRCEASALGVQALVICQTFYENIKITYCYNFNFIVQQ